MGLTISVKFCYGVIINQDIFTNEQDNDFYDWLDKKWFELTNFKSTYEPFTDSGEYNVGYDSNDPRISQYHSEIFRQRDKCILDFDFTEESLIVYFKNKTKLCELGKFEYIEDVLDVLIGMVSEEEKQLFKQTLELFELEYYSEPDFLVYATYC